MSVKQKLNDIDIKCRLCLVDGGCLSYLFDDSLLPKIANITKCTSIDIKEDDDLPNKVCHVCLYKLELWQDFKEQFMKSNEILLAHLASTGLDDLPADGIASKRKHAESLKNNDDKMTPDVELKKVKHEGSSLQPLEFASVGCDDDRSVLKELFMPEDDLAMLKDNSPQSEKVPVINISDKDTDGNENRKDAKSVNPQIQVKPTLVPLRVKHFGTRRGKNTEKRKASTKRWVARVARKKALLAATGEYASDTDSIVSENESKLSPVQKARAKTNADKEVEKQKRIVRALKNLETNMKGTYAIKHDSDTVVIADTDSDAKRHRTRSQSGLILENPTGESKNLSPGRKESKPGTISNSGPTNKENRFEPMECTLNELAINSDSLSNSVVREKIVESTLDSKNVFNPIPIRSELEIGDATFVVTSTLVLSDGHYLNKNNCNLPKGDGSLNVDESSQERNTDIIDAVQLRRINPKSSNESYDKKTVERCLNIEVEGTELEALQKVQAELAHFIEKDMKQKILNNNDNSSKNETLQNRPKDSFETLDQQLKTIVENAIKKNIAASTKVKKVQTNARTSVYRNQKTSTFSPAFVKAALRSKIFQPKVMLTRLDMSKAAKKYKMRKIPTAKPEPPKSATESPNIILGKRQPIFPSKYRSYDMMYQNSGRSDNSDDELVTSTPRIRKQNAESKSVTAKINDNTEIPTSTPATSKSPASVQQTVAATEGGSNLETRKARHVEKKICETVECDTTTKTLPAQPAQSSEKLVAKMNQNQKISANMTVDNDSNETINATPNQSSLRKYFCSICKQVFVSLKESEEHAKTHKTAIPVDTKHRKPRMMRCKRCHEIVDARLVRIHTCRSPKIHKCYVCNSTFRSEKMLVCHLETHDESEFSIENIERGQTTKKISNVTSTQSFVDQQPADSNTSTIESTQKEEPSVKETYTCFVCDKKFTDKDVLKDHLQQHCDDISEDETSIGKEQFQCAICGDTLDSEENLESHVEKHLFDDEDDNPNLISIPAEAEVSRKTEESYQCSQCPNAFSSEMLLAIHTQAHEEEAAIAEWERQSTEETRVDRSFVCAICDESFNTDAELGEHLVAHNDDNHVCFLCETPFSTLADLRTHVESH